MGAVGRLEDRVLGVEAGEAEPPDERNADAGQRQAADPHQDVGLRRPSPARRPSCACPARRAWQWITEPGAEEQQRLEEGVGDQVEHRRRIGADAGGEEHVAELAAGRIGDDPLDVVLRQADGGGEERRRGADHGHDRRARSARTRTAATGGRP